MKKVFLAVAMVSGFSGDVNAETFNGFYVGASAGTEARGTQYNVTNSSVNDQFNKNRVGALGILFGGYGHVTGTNFYLGGEFGVSAPITNKEDKTVNQSASDTVKYTRGVGLMGTLRLGHVFDKFNLLYARLGFDSSRDKATFKNAAGTADFSKQTWSFIPGFGFEHKWNHIVGGIEYSYAIGQKIKGKTTGSPIQNLKAQRKSHQVQFRISYMF